MVEGLVKRNGPGHVDKPLLRVACRRALPKDLEPYWASMHVIRWHGTAA